MLSFVKFERVNPNKRDVLQRLKDYSEVYEVFDHIKASEQADRCIQCGDPYCHNKCPLHNYIPAWLKQVSQRDPELAFALSNEKSPFPEILGKICPHDVLCEGDCTLNDGHGAIAIGAIETHINESAFDKGFKPQFSPIKNSKKVAIIGSGPSGISHATFLLREGIAVEMFERADCAGGLLTYGIPGFKLDKSKVKRRIEWLIEAGMKLHLNCEIGVDKSILELQNEFDAIFIGIGSTKGKFAGLDGESSKDVYLAMDFLTKIQQRNFGKNVKDFIDVRDKNVVVIGGGDTAMDCVRTSVREKAKSVKCLYRRDEKSMPGSNKEFINAKEEGVEFIFNVSPLSIKSQSDRVYGIELIKTSVNKSKVSNIEGSEYIEDADIIIYALGFDAEVPQFINDLDIKLNKWNGIIIDENFKTNVENIYAGGDSVRGANLAVSAAYDGRQAARTIIKRFSK